MNEREPRYLTSRYMCVTVNLSPTVRMSVVFPKRECVVTFVFLFR